MNCHVTAMVFTLDEEVNLPHCLTSLSWCDDIVVVDSGSTDKTVEIARAHGARVFTREFDGFGTQRNWAIENCQSKYPWILILDADERVPPALAEEINGLAKDSSADMGAAMVRRRFHMWGKWLRYSSLYPTWVVRLIHRDRVRYINRGHAETQEVQGETLQLKNDLIDENHKGIEEWQRRQLGYARKDAEFELSQKDEAAFSVAGAFSDPLTRRRELKKLHSRLPFRSLTFFLYSYIYKRGFMDGVAGFRFCRMRAQYQNMIVEHKKRLEAGP